MDNDNIIKKKLVQTYRALRLRFDYAGMNLLSEEAGNEKIASLLNQDQPFIVGRFGAVEMHLVSKYMQQTPYSDKEKEQALYAAGIFPNDIDTLNKFCEVYMEAMKDCDVLGVWEVSGEKQAIKEYCKNVLLVPSRAIEPYYYSTPWSRSLAGKKVLVIHPFVDSISKQLDRRNDIWQDKEVLPEFKSVEYIRAVQSNAGGKTEFSNWFEALDSMKKQVDDKDFDVAIVGAGAYGLPLCAYIKQRGKAAIQMSGATQILFGMKGKRWDEHPVISKFYNDAWIRPSDNEKPPEIQKVEGGSYW
ncbi:MAG: hypothetical protein LUG86_09315 [Oscillospiraceae bacterium]|nr:hypothetical protein [Oscillospiraceae bacterium]